MTLHLKIFISFLAQGKRKPNPHIKMPLVIQCKHILPACISTTLCIYYFLAVWVRWPPWEKREISTMGTAQIGVDQFMKFEKTVWKSLMTTGMEKTEWGKKWGSKYNSCYQRICGWTTKYIVFKPMVINLILWLAAASKYQLYITECLNIGISSKVKSQQSAELLVSQVLKPQEQQRRNRTLNLGKNLLG